MIIVTDENAQTDIRSKAAPKPASHEKQLKSLESTTANVVQEAKQHREEQRRFVEEIKKIVGSDRAVQLDVDRTTKQIVARIVDAETGRVVRQIPNEEALKIAANIQVSLDGLFVDQTG
ncbi:MAG: flagellar protein FlaG [Candidatus Margulisiibacteriota bacterium]